MKSRRYDSHIQAKKEKKTEAIKSTDFKAIDGGGENALLDKSFSSDTDLMGKEVRKLRDNAAFCLWPHYLA